MRAGVNFWQILIHWSVCIFFKSTMETLEQGVKSVKNKLKIKIPERRHWRCSHVFNINFEQMS